MILRCDRHVVYTGAQVCSRRSDCQRPTFSAFSGNPGPTDSTVTAGRARRESRRHVCATMCRTRAVSGHFRCGRDRTSSCDRNIGILIFLSSRPGSPAWPGPGSPAAVPTKARGLALSRQQSTACLPQLPVFLHVPFLACDLACLMCTVQIKVVSHARPAHLSGTGGRDGYDVIGAAAVYGSTIMIRRRTSKSPDST